MFGYGENKYGKTSSVKMMMIDQLFESKSN